MNLSGRQCREEEAFPSFTVLAAGQWPDLEPVSAYSGNLTLKLTKSLYQSVDLLD